MENRDETLKAAFEKMGLGSSEYHVFLCLGPNCCESARGQEVWETLKRLIKELKVPALRTKADCLRVCHSGPLMLVYPDGVWYGNLTPERCERIVREHLLERRPVKEWISETHRLPDVEP